MKEGKLIYFNPESVKDEETVDRIYMESVDCEVVPVLMLWNQTAADLIKYFNPKYVVLAGEDSVCREIGYPKIELTVYKVPRDQTKMRHGIPPEIEYFKTSNGFGMFIGQCEVCANMSIILLKEEDEELAKLLNTSLELDYDEDDIDELKSKIKQYIELDE